MRGLDRGHAAQAAIALIGLWLMAAPDMLGYGTPLAHSDHIAGPLLVTIGAISIWELNREARLAAIPVASWLLVAPWILDGPAVAVANDSAAALATLWLARVRGRPAPNFGGGWSAIWREPSPYQDETERASQVQSEGGNQ